MKNNKETQAIALPLEMERGNPFAAFSASSMMIVVKKDLFGLRDEQSSSPAAPTAW